LTPLFDSFLTRLRAEPEATPPSRYGPYRSYRGLWEQVEAVRARTGGRVEAVGRSLGGEPLWALTMGAPAPTRRVLYLANLHAQEFVGVEALLATLARAAEAVAAGAPGFEGVEIVAVPTANPDGYRRVLADLTRGGPRFRRKNARGVDLNRNFAEGHDTGAVLARLLPWIYAPGAAPLSEPETVALDGLFARRFDRALSFHSFGAWIFWPWAHTARATVDDARFRALAEAMRARMRRPYRAVQLGRWASWFAAGGAEIDHLYARHGTLDFLVEVSAGGRELARPSTWLDPFAWWNPRDPAADLDDVAAAALALATHPDP
jgi:hypothetical protein